MNQQLDMHRGRWLLHELTTMRSELDPWEHIPIKPDWMQIDIRGRYHQETGTWWTDAGEQTSPGGPRYKYCFIPGNPHLHYDGEVQFLTPGWKRTMEDHLHSANIYDELEAYERNMDKNPSAVCYWHRQRGRMVWGPHSIAMREVVLILATFTPSSPEAPTHPRDVVVMH